MSRELGTLVGWFSEPPLYPEGYKVKGLEHSPAQEELAATAEILMELLDESDTTHLLRGWAEHEEGDGSKQKVAFGRFGAEDGYRYDTAWVELISVTENKSGDVENLQVYKLTCQGEIYPVYIDEGSYDDWPLDEEWAWGKQSLDLETEEDKEQVMQVEKMLQIIVEGGKQRAEEQKAEADKYLPDLEAEMRPYNTEFMGLVAPRFSDPERELDRFENMLASVIDLTEAPVDSDDAKTNRNEALKNPGSLVKLHGIEIGKESLEKVKNLLEVTRGMREYHGELSYVYNSVKNDARCAQKVLDRCTRLQENISFLAPEQS